MVRREKHLHEFGPFTLDTVQHLLLRNGEIVPLTPKAIDVLVALVENSGNVLSRDELMKLVWPDTFVEEANLTHHISALRRALGEDVSGLSYIETIPRRGYRFAPSVGQGVESADVVVAEHSSSRAVLDDYLISDDSDVARADHDTLGHSLPVTRNQHAWSWRSPGFLILVSCAIVMGLGFSTYFWVASRSRQGPTGSGVKSIAVLPFKPLVAESRDEALEMGMAETLITSLSALREVNVRPTSAVRKYDDIHQDALAAGRALQVESVLDASIQKAGDRLRVTARLVRINDGATLWAAAFDERFTDIFAVQDRIAERMTAALALKVTGKERELGAKRYTESPEAYQLYVKGRYFWAKFTEDGLNRSIQLFEQAIEKDRTYALAYTGLAAAYIVLTVNGHIPPNEARLKAKYAAEKALELDDKLALAHQSVGGYKLFHEWDWLGAEREFKLAMELDPSLIEPHELYSYLLSDLGRFDEALAELRKAQALNPVAINIRTDYGDTLRQARRYDEAIAELDKTLEMDPNDFFLRFTLGLSYAQKGMYEKAIAELKKAVTLSANATRMLSGLGQVYGMAGRESEAKQVIARLQSMSKQRYVSPLYIAMVYATLGEKDTAFLWLEKAYEERASWLVELGIDPCWDNLRSDSRFKDLLRRVGLPQ